MRYFPPTLSGYLFRQFIGNFVSLLGGLLLVVYLFDTVELLRRGAKVDDLSVAFILQMGLYKLPEVGQQLFPFAVLFSALFTFWQLSRRSELVVARASGLSVWQFMMPLAFAAFLIGVVQMTVVNPVGALMIGKYERLESERLEDDDVRVTLSDQGLWLRQRTDEGRTVLIHAASVRTPEWELRDVMALYIDPGRGFMRRIDAETAQLVDGSWVFYDVVENVPGRAPLRHTQERLPTSLSVSQIEDSFAEPKTVPFWALPSYISTMAGTGFNTTPLRIEFQALIATPIFLAGMILLAACVALRPQRQGGTSTLILAGVLMGFVVFFLTNFLQALGASGQIPVFMAAWFPPVIYCLIGIGGLMILEDG